MCRSEVTAARWDGGGAHEDDGVLRWVLDGFEEGVGGGLGEAVGVFDDDDAPWGGCGHAGGFLADAAHGFDADG